MPPEHLGGAHRFRVTANLAGRLFETFMLDVGLRSSPLGEQDTLTTPDLLAFAEIEPVEVQAVPLERHVAEKLHAYTRRHRGQPSSRAKDLIDIVLISELKSFDFAPLRDVIVHVFRDRGTHELPASVPAPPSEWAQPYRSLAEEVGLDPDLAVGHRLASGFLNAVLADETDVVRWDAEATAWRCRE